MLKLCTLLAVIAACYSQTSAPIGVICKAINNLDCKLFAHHVQCGTNGVTYGNSCLFSKAHCMDSNIHVAHNGTCTTGGTGTITTPGGSAVYKFFCFQMQHKQCGTDVEELCGSDGYSYMNFCSFEKARCFNHNMYIAYYSKCTS